MGPAARDVRLSLGADFAYLDRPGGRRRRRGRIRSVAAVRVSGVLCFCRVSNASVAEDDRGAEEDEEQAEHEADQVEHEAVRADDAAKVEHPEKKEAPGVIVGDFGALTAPGFVV